MTFLIPSASKSSVAVSVSSRQLIKLIKSVTSLVLKRKKRKVTAISPRFQQKAPTNNVVLFEWCLCGAPVVLQKTSSDTLRIGKFLYFRQLWGQFEERVQQETKNISSKRCTWYRVFDCLHHSNPRNSSKILQKFA